MNRVTITHTRHDKSTYQETFNLTDWFCPGCGKKTVWEEEGEGDYYCGPEIICASCGTTMQHPLRAWDYDSNGLKTFEKIAEAARKGQSE